MIFYNTKNKGEFTNNETLARIKVKNGEWTSYGESEEEFVMQSDNSGYVPKSEYITLTTPRTPTLEQQIVELQLAMLELMNLGGEK